MKICRAAARSGMWLPEVEALIKSAISTGRIEDIKRQVENGAQLWVVLDDDAETVGAFVLRVDALDGWNEGVLVAGAGQIDGVDCTALMLPIVEKMFIGCQSMRIHTNRPGLMKKLVGHGYQASEIILRKAL